MRRDTIRALNAVNRRFYEERASEFDRTRERPWQGWDGLFDVCEPNLTSPSRILDVGCGNGRFARFYHSRFGEPAAYFGIDQSPLALEHARRRCGELRFASFLSHDFIEEPRPIPDTLESEAFELIVLFGVLHHVPGQQTRRSLLSSLVERLSPGGILAYSVWRFDAFERFRKKLVLWDAFRAATGDVVDVADLEPGDHIMTWGAEHPAYRYCHAMSEEEAEAAPSALGLETLSYALGDGDKNAYYALTTR